MPSFPTLSGTTAVEKISAYDRLEHIDRDIIVNIYKPTNTDINKPALIVLSGCNGKHMAIHKAVVDEFNRRGAVIAEVRSIEAYGDQCTRTSLSGAARAEHAFSAKELLVSKGLAETNNVGLIGLSHGGWTAIHASKMDLHPNFLSKLKFKQGGFKSEVQHLPPSKVSRCKAAHPSAINNSSLRIV